MVRRRTPLSPIDPATARELLIERGLVESEMHTNAKFVAHNRILCELIAGLAAKTRRREWVVDPYRLQQVYQARLPEDISDRVRLEKYDRTSCCHRNGLAVAKRHRRLKLACVASAARLEPSLYLRPDDLLDIEAEPLRAEDFPDELEIGSSRMPLEYRLSRDL